MLKLLTAAALLLCGPAFAADLGGDDVPAPDYALQDDADPVGAGMSELERRQSEAQAKAAARVAALENLNAGRTARVVVLKWADTEAGYDNSALQSVVKSRTARPDARFFPEIDLYQAGRKEPDRTVRPYEQRGSVPDDAIHTVEAAISQVETIPWNGLSETDWALKAGELRDLTQEIWFLDRPELREPLFKLYVQIGRAAENANHPVAPFYEFISGVNVNYYWYLAGAMAYEEPGLLSKLTDQDLNTSVAYYKSLLDNGTIELMTLAFEMEDHWDVTEYAAQYITYINGREVLIDSAESLYLVPPGRVDVYLERTDGGHSISDRIEIDKLDDKIYFVRDVARKKMGIDFISQLMEHPNECTPELDGDILNYLAIYARLHPDAEIYVTVAPAGVISKTMLWRFDRRTGTLQKVLDDTGGFPVRFVVMTGAGMGFNNASLPDYDAELKALRDKGDLTPEEYQACLTDPTSCVDTKLEPSSVPLMFQLRGHYNRLMMVAGVDYNTNISGTNFADSFQTDGHKLETVDGTEPLRSRRMQRLVYTGIGVVLGKDAAIGFGPRGWVRVGWANVPHTVEVSGHAGYTTQAPFNSATGRVRPMVDAEVFGGTMIPFGDTTFDKPLISFGATVGAGVTF